MTEAQYFECENCGQVVQGWGASRDIECCNLPEPVEIYGPRDDIPEGARMTGWGNMEKEEESCIQTGT